MRSVLLASDLMIASQLSGASQAAGLELSVVSDVAALREKLAERESTDQPLLVIVDLATPGVDWAKLLCELATNEGSISTIAFGPHVHAKKLELASHSGCQTVLTRGQFFAQKESIFADWVAKSTSKDSR